MFYEGSAHKEEEKKLKIIVPRKIEPRFIPHTPCGYCDEYCTYILKEDANAKPLTVDLLDKLL